MTIYKTTYVSEIYKINFNHLFTHSKWIYIIAGKVERMYADARKLAYIVTYFNSYPKSLKLIFNR